MQHVENIQLSEEFLALLAKYLTMETSPEENQLVEEWLKQKPANANVLLNINELIIREGKNMGTITECETQKVFPKLRLDYDKLIYSLFLGELITLFLNDEIY